MLPLIGSGVHAFDVQGSLQVSQTGGFVGGKICCFHVVVLPLIGSRVHAFDVQSPLQVSQTGGFVGRGQDMLFSCRCASAHRLSCSRV